MSEQHWEPTGPSPEGEGVQLQAYASGEAVISQAGRDQHFHYGDGLRQRRHTRPGTSPQECPYPGLAAFEREQARWFFGRDELVAELVARLDHRLNTGGMQLVVAPSGAGKSSLLRAGLLPRLEQAAVPGSDQWPTMVFTPTAQPLQAMVAQISTLMGTDSAGVAEEVTANPHQCIAILREALRRHIGSENSHARVVVVVDQFEELFTLCADESQRRVFIDLLTHLAASGTDAGTAAQPVGLVVVGVRADFYTACVNHPALRSALQDGPLVVGAMSEAELREAILYPAQDVGLDIEPGLVEVLLRDLGATAGTGEEGMAGYEAGRLPLLAHALRACWRQRHGASLTLEGYQITGGIQSAIATTAEQAFASLDSAGQRMARSLFLRLIKIGNETQDTRRRTSRAELVDASADPQTATVVVDRFTRVRLLTQHHDTVEITHEALLHSWPRLRRWIDSDRAGRLTHQDLEEATTAWVRGGHDSSLLYRGSRLETARAWAATASHHDLSPAADDFLAASIRQHRRTARLRTGVIAALTVLAVIATTTAGFAFEQRREALRQRDLAIYHRVLAEADRLHDTDTSLSAQLTLAAHRMMPGDETDTRLITTGSAALSELLTDHTHTVWSVAFSPDGDTLASASEDQTVRLWNISDPAQPTALGRPLTGHTSTIRSVAFSPDGDTLATASEDGTIRLWNVTDPTQPAPLGQPLTGHTGSIWWVAFSPSGRTLATAGEDQTIRLWDVTDPARPTLLGQPLTRHTSAVYSVAFSRDGHTLASTSTDQTIRLWNVSDPAQPIALGRPLIGHTSPVWSAAFSPDGDILATAGEDQTIRLWNLSRLRLVGHTSPVWSVAFSPDGHTLATVGEDKTVRLWDVSDPNRPAALGQSPTGHTGVVSFVAFHPDGDTLATASEDGTIRLWNVSDATQPTLLGRTLTGHTGAIWAVSVAFSPDGDTLAAGHGETVRLWNVSDPARPTSLGRPLTGHTGTVWSVAFSPDGRTLATAGYDETVRLWNVTDPARPAVLGKPLTGHTEIVSSVAFSPDGHTLTTASEDQTIRLWNVTDPAQPALLGQSLTEHSSAVSSVAFRSDGRTLATASEDGTVRLWDVSDPARPTLLGQPLTGHTGAIWSVAFSPDGRTLATASEDSTALLWGMNPDQAIQRICTATRNVLTPKEWQSHVSDEIPYTPPCG